jgi:hypothetical protein
VKGQMIYTRQTKSRDEIEIEIRRRALELAANAGEDGADIPKPTIVELAFDGMDGALWDLAFVDFRGAGYIEAAAREVSAGWYLKRDS